eukprot:TRINITY_DN164_c0_g1_i1.p1 TRINITY_DN164_c0_g1~~TRINITY_DN164_c0_g1_i1.p1  ORF type:complete len:421 (+),score=80.09 TRINITY_DN164_c0_g1_i1:68-1264(+)
MSFLLSPIPPILLLLLLLSSLSSPAVSLQCLNPDGAPVDHWFALKLPKGVGSFSDGYSLLYFDSTSAGHYQQLDFRTATKNPIARTVQQLGLYGGEVDLNKVGYALWNDETYSSVGEKHADNHEYGPNGVEYGHSKGLIGFDQHSGFFLSHSAPGFPYSASVSPSSWEFPYHQTYFAQHFFCGSFPLSEMEKITKNVLYYYAYVYDSNIPSALEAQLPSFSTLVAMKLTQGSGAVPVTTLGGQAFSLIGKSASTYSDLYEDVVSPILKTSTQSMTWCCGFGSNCCMPSFCEGNAVTDPSDPQKKESTYPFASMTVQEMSFSKTLNYTNHLNHAKWALAIAPRTGGSLSQNATPPWTCFADMNRMASQRKRGGGAICMLNQPLYDALTAAVTQTLTCGQ